MRRLLGLVRDLLGTPPPAAPSEALWPAEARAPLPVAATAMQHLLDREREWVHRRVETIEFLDVGYVRRQMSIDYTLPRLDGGREIPYLPILLLPKGKLRGFDVWDESARPLPVLTRSQSGPIATAFLIAAARLRLAELQKTLTEEVEAELRVIGADPATARRLATEDLAGEGAAAYLRLGRSSADDARALMDDTDYAEPWIRQLARHFVLFLETETTPLSRRIVKVRFEHPLATEPVTGRRVRRVPVRLWRRAKHALETFGLRAFESSTTAQVLSCASYHVELLAPEEVLISSAALLVRVDGKPVTLDTDASATRAALYARGVPPEVEGAWIEVCFRLKPGGLLVASFLCSLFTTLVLWTGSFLHRQGVVVSHDPLTALLLALPAAYAVFLVPGREHLLTRRMFKGLRMLVLVTAVIAFIAAAALTLTIHPGESLDVWRVHVTPSVPRIWFVLAVLSSAISVVLASSFAMSWRANRRVQERAASSDPGVH